MTKTIIDEILENIPKDAEISQCTFEGANIILYTKSKDFFLNNSASIKDIVNLIKKRIELRPDPSITLDMEKAEAVIKKVIPEEAMVSNVIFDPQRSQVIIETQKPGLAIGKAGELLREIKKQTLWVPLIRRTPSIRSKLIESIRQVLYENNDFRKKFLDQVGKRIYNGWIRGKREEWVRLTFLGGARQVGRSCMLLQTPESRVLIDCGINVAAPENEMYPFFDAPEFRINEIDAVIITHAHLDHCGIVPMLFKFGYEGPVYCTEPTRDVAALLCLDYIQVGQYETKKQVFTSTDVKNMVKHTICLDYEEVSDITPDIRLTFYNAGHNLGSSMAHLHIGNGLHNLLITGDFNYELSNLLAPAVTRFPRLETVTLESTYGAKDDVLASRKESEDYLIGIINDTHKRGGKVLMPTLGVGRSQELMIILERAMREGIIPKMPIYIQGMVWDVTAIHTAYPDFFNNKIKKQIFHQDENPFLSELFKQVGSQKEMEQVIESGDPCIIMATSGMMMGGASVEYFKAFAENPKHSLILTCYQGEGSLGRRLESGEKEMSFLTTGSRSEVLKVKMEIFSIHGFTGHSSRAQIMGFVNNLDPRPKRIITVHGESSKCLDLSSSIHKMFRIETFAPRNLDTIRLR